MLEGNNIICFGPTDWWGRNPSCTTHIMQKLAEKNKILYINPFSSDLSGGIGKGFWKRFTRKLKSLSMFLRRARTNLYVISPVFIPFQGNKIIDLVNNFFLKLQLKICYVFMRISKPILWVENPRAADVLEWFNAKIVIYHVSDLFEECAYTSNKKALRRREQTIRKRSDILICVSRKLYELNVDRSENVFYLPHGVDFSFFRKAVDNNKVFEKLENVTRPIVGYYGTLTAQNDIELLEYCANKLKNVTFVFGGQITAGDYSKLAQMPNVLFLGQIPYERIPDLCASFDVCLLPWKISKWITHCNPLKLQEYMASGKPIVSVLIDEAKREYQNLLSIGETRQEFCNAIIWELNNDTKDRSARRVEIARKHDWSNQTEELSQIINNFIGQN